MSYTDVHSNNHFSGCFFFNLSPDIFWNLLPLSRKSRWGKQMWIQDFCVVALIIWSLRKYFVILLCFVFRVNICRFHRMTAALSVYNSCYHANTKGRQSRYVMFSNFVTAICCWKIEHFFSFNNLRYHVHIYQVVFKTLYLRKKTNWSSLLGKSVIIKSTLNWSCQIFVRYRNLWFEPEWFV